ncbi:MAG: MOSC domain-containing protein [Marinobacter sp.]|nr:MOSC domain-containing protein [Marinobacter sp.]
MQVDSLFIYPVKSLAGIPVTSLALDARGPEHDRRWMIIDNDGSFVTQRDRPELARISTTLTDGKVSIGIPGFGDHPLRVSGEQRNARVWQDWVRAYRAEPGPAQLLSDFCGQSLDLVYMPDDCRRTADAQYAGAGRPVGFADGFPFLIVNRASLDELNSRLDRPVDIRRFRPNIVVSGAEAWAEDQWPGIIIGLVAFNLVKPCSRCLITTVDPDSGVRAGDLQPLRTLGSYRRQADGVMFGVNAVHQGTGPVKAGDPVIVDTRGVFE